MSASLDSERTGTALWLVEGRDSGVSKEAGGCDGDPGPDWADSGTSDCDDAPAWEVGTPGSCGGVGVADCSVGACSARGSAPSVSDMPSLRLVPIGTITPCRQRSGPRPANSRHIGTISDCTSAMSGRAAGPLASISAKIPSSREGTSSARSDSSGASVLTCRYISWAGVSSLNGGRPQSSSNSIAPSE